MGGGSTKRDMNAAVAASAAARRSRRDRGLAHAAAWHAAVKPHFDRLFGFEPCDCPVHAPLDFARDRGGLPDGRG